MLMRKDLLVEDSFNMPPVIIIQLLPMWVYFEFLNGKFVFVDELERGEYVIVCSDIFLVLGSYILILPGLIESACLRVITKELVNILFIEDEFGLFKDCF